MAGAARARLVVVGVVEAAGEAAQGDGRARLEALVGTISPADLLVRQGAPAAEIVAAATREQADLLILGAPALGLARALGVDVVSRALRSSACSVLRVRPAVTRA